MKRLITQRDYDAALAKGRAELAEPHAIEVRFVGRTTTMQMTFSNGLCLIVDARALPGLQGHTAASLGRPYVTSGGDGLVFDKADLAFNLPNLIAPVLPIELARSRVAAEAGKVSTPRKARAARANGAKGGRPRKTPSMLPR